MRRCTIGVSLLLPLAACGDNARLLADAGNSQPDSSSPSAFVSISAGTSRTCAVKADGSLWCWGTGAMTEFVPSSGAGDLGGLVVPAENVPLTTDTPTQVVLVDSGGNPIGDAYVAVSVGLFKECAITNQHALVCFTLPDTHADSLGGTDWATVSVGDTDLCAIDRGGAMTCWGGEAQLETSYPYGGYQQYQRVDYIEDLGSNWSSVTCGRGRVTDRNGEHGVVSVGLRVDGTAWSWQPNGGPTEFAWTWLSITRGSGRTVGVRSDHILVTTDGELIDTANDWATVVGGASHFCATKLDGTAYCWGNANLGRVGLDPPAMTEWPTSALPGTWQNVSAGGVHSCGIQMDGTAWCWGADNTLGGVRLQPKTVPLAAAAQIDVSGSGGCAIASGSLKCWGGAGLIANRVHWAQAPTAVDDSHAWTSPSLSAGGCAIRDDSTLWCWGYVPNMPGATQWPLEAMPGTGWASVAVGALDICAIKTDHTMYCLGGQVAGTTWAQVGTGRAWMVAATNHNYDERYCATTTTGELWCWGVIETSTGTEYISATPVQIAGSWVSLSLRDEDLESGSASCAIKFDHTLWCGGGFAQQVPGSNWISVSASSTTCGIQSDHSLWCWPDPRFTNNVAYPSQIPGAWQAVATRNSSTSTKCDMPILGTIAVSWCPNVCAIAVDGSLSCWGVDNYGQVGDASSWKPVPTRIDI